MTEIEILCTDFKITYKFKYSVELFSEDLELYSFANSDENLSETGGEALRHFWIYLTMVCLPFVLSFPLVGWTVCPDS